MSAGSSIICGLIRHQHFIHAPTVIPLTTASFLIRFRSTIATQNRDEDLVSCKNDQQPLKCYRSHIAHISPSRSIDFSSVKHGMGTLVATATPADATTRDNVSFVTQLSTVAHKAPVRLIPTRTSSPSLAKQVSISHYGGGMTEGDTVSLNIHVQSNARLHVRTQGTNRVYGHGVQKENPINANQAEDEEIPVNTSINSVIATVDEHAMLVYAPDPVSLHKGSQYKQFTNYVLKDLVTSNLVAIDWICSGRQFSFNSEHWNQDTCTTRTTLRFKEDQQTHPIPLLIDAQSITAEGMYAVSSNQRFHAIVTVMLSGSIIVNNEKYQDSVVQRFILIQSALAALYTAVRYSNEIADNKEILKGVQHLVTNQLSKGGRVVLGVSQSEISTPTVSPTRTTVPVYTIRLAASSNEDVYRILHYCLQPLAPYLGGIECYKDRIVTASQSPPTGISPNHGPPVIVAPSKNIHSQGGQRDVLFDKPLLPLTSENATDRNSNFWAAFMLADSALPIGSFAHSSGIEVASQLGFLENGANVNQHDSIATFVRTAVISSLQLSTPLIVYSSRQTEQLLVSMDAKNKVPYDCDEQESLLKSFLVEWVALDAHSQAMLATNAPACRASLDQGRNLLRVARSAFLATSSTVQNRRNQKIIDIMQDATNTLEQSKNLCDCGHFSTVFGVMTRLLLLNDEDAVRLHAYCVARNIVNAAVRLNLIGPMAGQEMLLNQAEPAAHQGILQAYAAIQRSLRERGHSTTLWKDRATLEAVTSAAMGCAPVLDAIHPCQDVLATRLFRT